MEAGPFCNAVYEIADADRYPVGEAVNFAKLPIDFGIIHYASDTPYTQARTLGARGIELLRDGLHLRLVAGDPAPHPAPGRGAPRGSDPPVIPVLRPDRVPGGLQLGDPLEPLERVGDRLLVAGRRPASAERA